MWNVNEEAPEESLRRKPEHSRGGRGKSWAATDLTEPGQAWLALQKKYWLRNALPEGTHVPVLRAGDAVLSAKAEIGGFLANRI